MKREMGRKKRGERREETQKNEQVPVRRVWCSRC